MFGSIVIGKPPLDMKLSSGGKGHGPAGGLRKLTGRSQSEAAFSREFLTGLGQAKLVVDLGGICGSFAWISSLPLKQH